MLKKYVLGLYIILILFAFTADSDYITTSNGYLIPGLSIESNGSFLIAYKTLDNNSFKGEPCYNVEVQSSSNRVNTGDSFSMNLFISGVGVVDFAKIRVNIPKYIVKDDYVKLEAVVFDISSPESGKIRITPFIDATNLEPAFNLNVPNIHFNPSDIRAFVNYGETTIAGIDNPPYRINFTISPKASAGDHNIHINLFYKSSGKWYSDSQIVPVHINNWYENEKWQIVVILALITSMISAWPIIRGCWGWIRNKLII